MQEEKDSSKQKKAQDKATAEKLEIRQQKRKIWCGKQLKQSMYTMACSKKLTKLAMSVTFVTRSAKEGKEAKYLKGSIMPTVAQLVSRITNAN